MPMLKGMTWDHSRGFDPMVATAAEYARSHPDVQIVWERRSLQAFADVPLEQLASQYDLLVIDHPHVGEASRQGCLLALESTGRQRELATLALQSLGGSHQSYAFEGHQWALAIDAATQVACYRPDLLPMPPSTWDQVIQLAKSGKVLWPIKPVDALMSLPHRWRSPADRSQARTGCAQRPGRSGPACARRMSDDEPDRNVRMARGR
jgi:multiple sugar transport system substrate-binding protein